MDNQDVPQMKPKKKRALTIKQALYIKNLKKTKNKEKALLLAGYKQSTAHAQNVGKSRTILETMRGALERRGIDQDALANVIKDGMKAERKTNKDHKIRLESAKLGAQLGGYLDTKINISHQIGDMSEEETAEALKKALEIVNKG